MFALTGPTGAAYQEIQQEERQIGPKKRRSLAMPHTERNKGEKRQKEWNHRMFFRLENFLVFACPDAFISDMNTTTNTKKKWKRGQHDAFLLWFCSFGVGRLQKLH